MRVSILTLAASLLLVVAPTLSAPLTVVKTADEWGTIGTSGPRAATGGNRWWNISDSRAKFPSTAALRFHLDGTGQDDGVIARFNRAFGEGQWRVTNIRIVLEHDDSTSSAAGPVNVYHFTNDELAITNGEDGDGGPGDFGELTASPLRYSKGAKADGKVIHTEGGDFGAVTLVDSYRFVPEGDGDLDVLGPKPEPADAANAKNATPDHGVNLPDAAGDTTALLNGAELVGELNWRVLAEDIEEGTDALSLIVTPNENDGAVAATYKGNVFQDKHPPRIYIEADKAARPGPAAEASGSGND